MKSMDHDINHAHFCVIDNDAFVTVVCMKVSRGGESHYRVEAFFY